MNELIDSVGFDLAFGTESKLFFDFDFNPQSLAVKAILVAQVSTIHGPIALKRVLVRAAPGMVDAHGVIGRDGSIEKAPWFLPGNFLP